MLFNMPTDEFHTAEELSDNPWLENLNVYFKDRVNTCENPLDSDSFNFADTQLLEINIEPSLANSEHVNSASHNFNETGTGAAHPQKKNYRSYSAVWLSTLDMKLHDDKNAILINCEDEKTTKSLVVKASVPYLYYALESAIGCPIRYRKQYNGQYLIVRCKRERSKDWLVFDDNMITKLKEALLKSTYTKGKKKHLNNWIEQSEASNNHISNPAVMTNLKDNLASLIITAEKCSPYDSFIKITSSNHNLIEDGASLKGWPDLFDAISHVLQADFELYKLRVSNALYIWVRLDNHPFCLEIGNDFINLLNKALRENNIQIKNDVIRTSRTHKSKRRFDMTAARVSRLLMMAGDSNQLVIYYHRPDDCLEWDCLRKAIVNIHPSTVDFEYKINNNLCEIILKNECGQKVEWHHDDTTRLKWQLDPKSHDTFEPAPSSGLFFSQNNMHSVGALANQPNMIKLPEVISTPKYCVP